jgi:hypothetical protein
MIPFLDHFEKYREQPTGSANVRQGQGRFQLKAPVWASKSLGKRWDSCFRFRADTAQGHDRLSAQAKVAIGHDIR